MESLLAAGAEISLDEIEPYEHFECIKYDKNYDKEEEPYHMDSDIDHELLDELGLIDIDQLEIKHQEHNKNIQQHDKNDRCIKVAVLVDQIYSGSEITNYYVEIIIEHPELYDLFSSRLTSHIMNRGMIEGCTDIKNYLEGLRAALPKELINMIQGKLIDQYVEHDYGKQIPGQKIPDTLGVDEEIKYILKDSQIQKVETLHVIDTNISSTDQDANTPLSGQAIEPLTESIF